MKKYYIIFFIAMFAFISCKSEKSDRQSGKSIETRPINGNIGLRDVNGNELTLEQFKGKVILLNFWTSWVVSTPAELNLLKKIADSVKQSEFKIVSVSLDDPYSDGFKKFISTLDVNYEIYVSPTSSNNTEIIKSFPEIKDKIPCYYVLDKKMAIKKYGKDLGDSGELIKIINECLNEK